MFQHQELLQDVNVYAHLKLLDVRADGQLGVGDHPMRMIDVDVVNGRWPFGGKYCCVMGFVTTEEDREGVGWRGCREIETNIKLD